MPPLLQRLSERRPETLDYLGVSYGLTPQLLRFWKRAGYVPLYLRQTTSELTGEHTCVMIRGLNSSTDEELQWVGEFAKGKNNVVKMGLYVVTDRGCVGRFPKTIPHAAVVQVQGIW
jgi:hypothetical protein